MVTATSIAQNTTHSDEDPLLAQILENQQNSNNVKLVTVSFSGIPIADALEMLASKINVGISYNPEIIPDKRVTLNSVDTPFHEIIYKILEGTNLEPVLPPSKDVIVIREKKVKTETELFQETVTGSVVDAQTGEALPGVNILIQGTTEGTSTDADGNFELEVSDLEQILVITYVGYERLEIPIDGRTQLNIEINPLVVAGEELVVVGYGTQERVSMTSAVSDVQVEKIADYPISNLSQGLVGNLSGVITKQGSGEPGSDAANIFIRGISTTGSTQPLIVVDGIARDDYTSLNPNSIESVTVLKDAAAVAPYGVAGANGVVLVKTKRGTGDLTLTYMSSIGFQNPTVLPDYINGYEYAKLRNAAASNDGLPLPYSEDELRAFQTGSDPDRYPPMNDRYDRVLTKNSPMHNHNLELSGLSDRINYYVSFGYQYQGGLWETTYGDKYNLVSNVDIEATSTTNITLNVNGRYQKNTTPFRGDGRLFELIGWVHPGIGPLLFSNGMSGSYLWNNLHDSGYWNRNTTALYSNLSIEQELPFILPGLFFEGTFAYDPSFDSNKRWRKPIKMASIDNSTGEIIPGIFGPSQPQLTQGYNRSQQLTYIANLNYELSLRDHTIRAMTVFEAQSRNASPIEISRVNYNLNIDEISMGSPNRADAQTSGSSTESKQLGLVYRVNYNYAEKYLLELSGRYDGHYYFAPGERWGFFPAFSAGWRLSEENFMKENLSWINDLKIRGSYGEVGALAGSPFQYLTTYSVQSPAYVLGGSAAQGLRERAEPNPNITWEKAAKYNIGLEANLWNRLLSFQVDYFYEKRSNMLVEPDVVVPIEYGIGLSQVNDGIMENKGVEFSASTFHNISNDFQINLSGNITYTKNALLQVFETDATYNNPNRRRTGRPLGTQFGYNALGFFQEADFNAGGTLKEGIASQPWGGVQPGDIRYEDINGDGVINDDDITVIGDASMSPRIVYGISSQIGFKGFTLDLLLQGAAKTNWYPHNAAIMPFYNGMNAYTHNLDYWTPENTNAQNPRITTSPTANNAQRSSFWMQDASYLRLKSATFAYSISSSITQKIGIRDARIYISGQNLLTWTKMKDFDPEIPGGRSTGWNYPQQRVISIGLNITL